MEQPQLAKLTSTVEFPRVGDLDQILLAPTGGRCPFEVYGKNTTDPSPEIVGRAPPENATVTVTIDGNNYVVSVTDGVWTLAQGTITPDLATGSYDVDVQGLCDGELTVFTAPGAIVVQRLWIWQDDSDHIWQNGDLADFQ